MANSTKCPPGTVYVPDLLTRNTAAKSEEVRLKGLLRGYKNRPVLTRPSLGPLHSKARWPNVPIPTVKQRRLVPSFAYPAKGSYALGGASGLGSVLDEAKSLWEKAKAKVFGSDDTGKALADLNRVVSVLVGARGTILDRDKAGQTVTNEMRVAYSDLFAKVKTVLTGVCEKDPSFRIAIPDDVGMHYYLKCVQTMSRDQWHAQIPKRSFDASTGKVSGFGALGIVPVLIVVAIVILSASAVAVTYLGTAEGRTRMEAAKTSAEAAGVITKAVAEGKISSSEAQQVLAQVPRTPEAAPSTISSMGKILAIGAVAIGGLAVFLKLRQGQSTQSEG